ncbi:hypothetical protein [Pseudonocardia sp. TRM90224]|uniref:hypothetical protein n=1 Tax=Pseudonocardia sp. TRM90224 TaxID=2812678 RepID=UPI001E51363B|nr:hypothetical protein [Pseudonocardia sp. TRM90224]
MQTVIADARRGHPGLFWLAVGSAALAVVLVGLAAVDHRTLLGAPLWFKPLKFALSFVLYGAALAWMLGQLRVPAMRRVGWVAVVASVVELVIIVFQAARGVRSHFNDDDVLGVSLYALMGVTVAILWLATLAIALRFFREPARDRAATVAIRLGIIVSLAGMTVGVLMSFGDAHAVGLPDGGPGLPLLGWSTTGGDLRVAHFIGMHALQLLPLLAAGLAAAGTRLTEDARVRVVRVVAAGYLGLTALLTWQALRAEPLFAPSATTLAVAAALAVAVAVGLSVALRPNPSRITS